MGDRSGRTLWARVTSLFGRGSKNDSAVRPDARVDGDRRDRERFDVPWGRDIGGIS